MRSIAPLLIALFVGALAACQPAPPPTKALTPELAAAFATLKTAPDEQSAEAAVHTIAVAWMRSGSATVDVLMDRAGQTADAGDLAKAMRLLNEAIALKPDFAEAYNRRATLAFIQEDFPAALKDLEKTLSLEPRHFNAMAGLGAVYETLNRPTEALKAYRDALALHPRFEQAKQGEARLARIVEGIDA